MHIYILPQCSTTAASVLNSAGMDAQFERSCCAISRGILTIDVAGGHDCDGDFRALQNYTWGTIFMLAHELGHYYEYLNRVSLTPRGIEWQATYYAHRVQEAYYDAEWDEMDEWAEERADES